MRALLDVNVLIAMADEEHVHYEIARRWWAENRKAGWASCPLTENGFLRILSQPRYPNPVSIPVALGLLRKAIAAEDHSFWFDDVSLLDPGRFDGDRILGPKQLTDVYLLALAVKNGGRLVTFDRTIPVGAVRGADDRNVMLI